MLRHEPALVKTAFDEAIRLLKSVQTFFRTTTRETVISGISKPDNAKVALFLASANRNPRKWKTPIATISNSEPVATLVSATAFIGVSASYFLGWKARPS